MRQALTAHGNRAEASGKSLGARTEKLAGGAPGLGLPAKTALDAVEDVQSALCAMGVVRATGGHRARPLDSQISYLTIAPRLSIIANYEPWIEWRGARLMQLSGTFGGLSKFI